MQSEEVGFQSAFERGQRLGCSDVHRKVWYASTNVLNLMRAITGSQWRSVSSRVVCVYLGALKIRRAAAFWIRHPPTFTPPFRYSKRDFRD